jgi:hypothetical protein
MNPFTQKEDETNDSIHVLQPYPVVAVLETGGTAVTPALCRSIWICHRKQLAMYRDFVTSRGIASYSVLPCQDVHCQAAANNVDAK